MAKKAKKAKKAPEPTCIVCPRLGAEAITSPYRATCYECGADLAVTTASYEAWQTRPAPHTAICIPCWEKTVKPGEGVEIHAPTDGQVREFLAWLLLKSKGLSS